LQLKFQLKLLKDLQYHPKPGWHCILPFFLDLSLAVDAELQQIAKVAVWVLVYRSALLIRCNEDYLSSSYWGLVGA
jgi:hypothetical protein